MSKITSTFNHNLILSSDFVKDFNNENVRIFCSLGFTPGNSVSIKCTNTLTQKQLAEIFQDLADSLKTTSVLL